jgi:hypothetical protein
MALVQRGLVPVGADGLLFGSIPVIGQGGIMADLNVELAVPFATRTAATVDLASVGQTLKAVFVKAVAALVAGGALALNVWVAGIFNGGHPVSDFSVQFFLLILAQAGVVTYVIALSKVIAVDVAGGILGGILIIIIVDLAGAFRGAFDVAQLLAQLLIAYFAVAAVIVVASVIRDRRSPPAAPPSSS